MKMHSKWGDFGGCSSTGNLAGTRAGRHPAIRKIALRSGGRIRHAGEGEAKRPEGRQTEARREMAGRAAGRARDAELTQQDRFIHYKAGNHETAVVIQEKTICCKIRIGRMIFLKSQSAGRSVLDDFS